VRLLNTLYVATENAYIRSDHETLRVEVEGEKRLAVPLHVVSGLVCFGNVLVSPAVIRRCSADGLSLVWLDRGGRFVGRLQGPTQGNVLLRQAQHTAVESGETTLAVAKAMVAGKVRNCRQVLLRAARQAGEGKEQDQLHRAADTLAASLGRLETAADLDSVRGCEGEAARSYFMAFDAMVRVEGESFRMKGRTRRPPRDRLNALLSFLYTLLANDCVGAAEAAGLDPQVGFLHAVRPGRPALALDLMEELRPVLADRLALTLINRRQLGPDDFVERPGGAVLLGDEPRKTVVAAYQDRKREEVFHAAVERRVPLGLIPHVQARLLARLLRGDLDGYVPFLYR